MYYDYLDTLTIGAGIQGVVVQARQFGLFINLGGPFLGLIDIGHRSFNGGVPLPADTTNWPKAGDEISCVISYFRLHGQQIGLGWSPTSATDRP